jgi:hypothetical protein
MSARACDHGAMTGEGSPGDPCSPGSASGRNCGSPRRCSVPNGRWPWAGPPLSISMDFIASSLVNMVAGLAQACVLFGFTWWAPPVLAGGWLGTHWLLRESAVWRDRNTPEVRQAQRDADYAYRLAVDPPAAKELRVFGLPDWVLERFVVSRRRLHRLQYEATRMRERSPWRCSAP